MTREEGQAIQALLALVENLQTQLTTMEKRLCDKLDKFGNRIDGIEDRCRDREQRCATLLAQRKDLFEREIREAEEAAVTRATAPSIYAQATRGILGFIVRLVLFAGAVVAMAVGLHHLWN